MFAPIPSDNDEIKEISEETTQMMARQMHADTTLQQNIPILIIDNAADMSMVGQGFEILFHTGETTTLWGAIAALNGFNYDIVCAAAVTQSPASSQEYIIIINQAPMYQIITNSNHCYMQIKQDITT